MATVNLQTEVTTADHETLRRIASKRHLSLKAAVQEAVHDYIAQALALEDDSLSDLIGTGTLPAGRWSERKDWRDTHADLH